MRGQVALAVEEVVLVLVVETHTAGVLCWVVVAVVRML
jgi:hypothetical protein